MGGSGGYFSGRVDPEELRKRVREAEEKALSEGFETEVGNAIAERLAGINNRDVEGINRILDKVKKDLETEVGETVNLLFGGSVAKHTFVDGLSDIDALVTMKDADVEGKTPSEMRKIFADKLRSRFGRDAVEEGTLAVNLKVDGKDIQLLPARREGTSLKISNQAGTQWLTIDPESFAGKLTSENQRLSGKLVPTIKLAKSIIGSFPEQRRITGYHTEALALEVFEHYTGTLTPKAMLPHFFEKAPQFVKRPLRDVTGQSSHVDDYLGPQNSIERGVVADALARVARRLRNADGAQSVDQWVRIIEGE